MKILIVSLALLMATLGGYSQVFGKKKSKNADPRDAQIDSLTTLTKKLTLQVDSMSIVLGKYNTVSDSLKVQADTTTVLLAAAPLTPALSDSVPVAVKVEAVPVPLIVEPKGPAAPDSLLILKNKNRMLGAQIDSLKTAWDKNMEILTSEEVVKSTAINDLKKLKELLDSGIITVAEFTVMKKKYLEKL